MHVHLDVLEHETARRLTRSVGTRYGPTPELALELLTLALMHAERPLLLDTGDELLEFDRAPSYGS